jgi:hypothetical protein
MKSFYSIFLLLFTIVVAHAQPYETNPDFNRTRNWHFGHGVGLRFDPDTIYEVPTSINTHEAAAVHSDADGNLLLYSNGEKIWDANHQVIHNGYLALGHNSSRMGSVFVYHEDNPDSIYLFNTYYNLSTTKEFSVNLIVKEADTFRIVYKDSVLMYSVCEPIAVVKADNRRDVWVIVQEFGANNLYSYMLTAHGIIPCPVVSKSYSTPFGSPHAAFFNFAFSSDGKYLLKTNTNLFPIADIKVELYKFDNNTGFLNYMFGFSNLSYPVFGISFSHNNSNIYIVERDSHLIRCNFNPLDSISTISSMKKVFINEENKAELQKFTYKNSIGLSIGLLTELPFILNSNDTDTLYLKRGEIGLTNGLTYVGLPNFNQSFYFSPSINFSLKLDCVLNTIQFYGQDTFNAINHSWLITKQSAIPITADTKAPLIKFEDTGTYQVRYIASNVSRSDTVIKTIEILPKIGKNFLGNDTGWCNVTGTPIVLQAPTGMHCYEWSTGETSSQISADTVGVYVAKITTPNFCVIYDTIKVSVDTVETVVSDFLGEDKIWCENIDTVVTLKALDNYANYKWSNNLTSQEIIVSEEGIYIVEAFKRNQCFSGGNLYALDTIEITLLNAPNKPTLNRVDDSLYTNVSGYKYEWYHNNSLLNDTNSYLILPDTGFYFLKVINSNNCVNYSDTLHVATLGIDNPLFNRIKIYPNPTKGVFTVDILNGEYLFVIKDVAGKTYEKGKLILGVNQIDISTLSDGIYFITINNNQNSITYKLIKQSE